MVRNLPVTVNSFQLQLFFSKHGKVSDAKILYYKKTKRSQGIGLLNLSTVHAHQKDALDALSGLIFEGCKLEVILVKVGRPRYGRRRRCTRSLDILGCTAVVVGPEKTFS
jgi:RNA recognition motif-containing protein